MRGAGVDLAVTEFGDPSAPTVVLVHGFPDTSAVWHPIVAELAPSMHVVTYDVRGAGASGAPKARSEYALQLLVKDMAAVCDATSPERPVHLVAHDWGSLQGWEAVTSDLLAGRLASYVSISGPPLDHVALWSRAHRSLRPSDVRVTIRQAIHSWYVGFFHIPVLPKLMARAMRLRLLWNVGLRHLEHAKPDDAWPASTLPEDFAHGIELYRANVRSRLRQPAAGFTETPVQIVVPLHDRYIMPALLEGLEEWSSAVWRREVHAGHWVIRTDPVLIADAVRQMAAFAEHGTEDEELARWRLH